MNANQANYHAVSDGHGGVTLIPRKGSAMEKAMKRLYPNTRFWDAPIPLQSLPGTAQNNLRLPGYKTAAKPPETADRARSRDNGDPSPLDPDLRQLARKAGSSNIVQDIYREQAKRDAKRGFDATGCDCTEDQGPSPTKAVQAVTRGVNRLSEAGEGVNRHTRGPRYRRARDQQLPDDYQGEDFQQHQDPDQQHAQPDGDETIIGTLDPPPDGFRYALVESDGEIAVILQPDLGERNDPDLTTADRTYRHRVFGDGADPVTRRQNAVNRAFWMKDQAESTLIRHKPGPGNKLALRGPNEFGSYDLVLLSWSPEDDVMHEQAGAEELDESDPGDDGDWLPQPEPHDPIQRQQPNMFRDSVYRVPEAVTIRQMNQDAKAFWVKR